MLQCYSFLVSLSHYAIVTISSSSFCLSSRSSSIFFFLFRSLLTPSSISLNCSSDILDILESHSIPLASSTCSVSVMISSLCCCSSTVSILLLIKRKYANSLIYHHLLILQIAIYSICILLQQPIKLHYKVLRIV